MKAFILFFCLMIPGLLVASPTALESYPRIQWDTLYNYVYDGSVAPEAAKVVATFRRTDDQGVSTSETTAHFHLSFDGAVTRFDVNEITIKGTSTGTISDISSDPAGGWIITVTGLEPGDVVFPVAGEYTVFADCGIQNLRQPGHLEAAVRITDNETYYDWLAGYGVVPGTLESGPGADLDDDGRKNEIEYLLDTSPVDFSTINAGITFGQQGDTSEYGADIRSDNTRITAQIQRSFDLVQWDSLEPPEVTRSPLGNGFERLETVLVSSLTPVFYRLASENTEHEVVGNDSPPPEPVPVNVALLKPATQSSTFGDNGAFRAVDSDTDSFNHTLNEVQPWWQVDMEAVFDLAAIEIWNRVNQPQRLTNFYVFISENPISGSLSQLLADPNVTALHEPGQAGYPTTFNLEGQNVSGRYLRVQLDATNFLHMTEVVVRRVE